MNKMLMFLSIIVVAMASCGVFRASLRESDPIARMEFVRIKGGCFNMGDAFGDGAGNEKPTHEVCIDTFFIGKYEVTQKQWDTVIGSNNSRHKGPRMPVVDVSWNDVHEFIEKLNQKYEKNYRLPTEAEWEYAAKGGNRSKGYRYSGSNVPDEIGWFGLRDAQPVGLKKPNELGLYDMSGNVWELVQDWFGLYAGSMQRNNPTGPAEGIRRGTRGGARNEKSEATCSYRGNILPFDKTRGDVGFRLAFTKSR